MSKLSPAQMVAGGGGIALIFAQFLSWESGVFGGSASAFDAFSAMDIIMLLVGAAAAAYAAAFAVEGAPPVPPRAPWILSIAGVVVFGWALGWDLENSQAGIGSWLALAASAAIAYGTYAAGSGTPIPIGGASRGSTVGPRTPSATSTPTGARKAPGAGAPTTPTTPGATAPASPPPRRGGSVPPSP